VSALYAINQPAAFLRVSVSRAAAATPAALPVLLRMGPELLTAVQKVQSQVLPRLAVLPVRLLIQPLLKIAGLWAM
ncbi:MAG: hypothetical protein LBE57_03310, partial [Methanosarcinales archaeon]|nr:hypothetical protein [Methanosarcinales archaeon]